ncbi:hypothetical protein HK100_010822 [Physocladia obscura]|uniref:Ankyrin repeat protein n=1 Tax=Physocladia obscura TaxID=109957 RepID=A0AAD5XHE1_9FUNG|nr:hypothetical protein HK100_010822 [Physocladia obscura]
MFTQVKALIDCGALVNARSDLKNLSPPANGGGILQATLLTTWADDRSVLELLFKHGLDAEPIDTDGDTAIVFAASSTLIHSARVLLENDLLSSSPFNLMFALAMAGYNRNASNQNVTKLCKLLISWINNPSKRNMVASKLGCTVNMSHPMEEFPCSYYADWDETRFREQCLQMYVGTPYEIPTEQKKKQWHFNADGTVQWIEAHMN